MIKDKNNTLGKLTGSAKVKLELGSGDRKRYSDSIGIDILDLPNVDIVGDACEILRVFPTQSVDAIYAYHFLEHVEDLNGLLKEISRVLKEDGVFDVVVPHFSNAYYYSDPTHRRFFGLYTFSYLLSEEMFARKVPQYQSPFPMKLVKVDLRFKSARPFYLRHLVRRLFGFLANSCRYTKELYEENFSGIISCYEIHYIMTKKSSAGDRIELH